MPLIGFTMVRAKQTIRKSMTPSFASRRGHFSIAEPTSMVSMSQEPTLTALQECWSPQCSIWTLLSIIKHKTTW